MMEFIVKQHLQVIQNFKMIQDSKMVHNLKMIMEAHPELTRIFINCGVLWASFLAIAVMVNCLTVTIGFVRILEHRSLEGLLGDEYECTVLGRPPPGSRRSSRQNDIEHALDDFPDDEDLDSSLILPTSEMFVATGFQYTPYNPISRFPRPPRGGGGINYPMSDEDNNNNLAYNPVGRAIKGSVNYMEIFWSTVMAAWCVVALGGDKIGHLVPLLKF